MTTSGNTNIYSYDKDYFRTDLNDFNMSVYNNKYTAFVQE